MSESSQPSGVVADADPSVSAFERAETQLRQRRTKEACRSYSRAEEFGFDPDACAAGRWVCHMLEGNFELAWRESDLIARRGRPDPHRFWDGRPLDGKRVLLRCLHGLGDTLQFLRYAPMIRECASSLTIEAQPALKKLITLSQLADEVITWGEAEPPWDQQIEIMELPRIFRTTIETIPKQVPYLKVPCSEENCTLTHRSLRVGLVWNSSAYNPARSVPVEELSALLSIPGIAFFSFQAGEARGQIAGKNVTDVCDETDIVAVAQKLRQMDLTITVDTMVAHLAGALGVKVWTLLPFECDWRWMMQRSDSPWYPTMKLFRQSRPGDWKRVMRSVQTDLLSMVQQVTCLEA